MSNILKNTIGFEINKQGLFTADGTSVKNEVMFCRSDNNEHINIAKKSYPMFSNAEFEETAHKIQDISGLKLLGFTDVKSVKVLAYFENIDKLSIGGLEAKNYMTLGNSHNGTTNIFVGSSNIIARCDNQFSSLSQSTSLKVSHSQNMTSKVAKMLTYFSEYKKETIKIEELFNKMQTIKIDKKLMESLTLRLLNIDEKSVRSSEKKDMLFESINRETLELGYTAFGWFNGVTHFTTHKMKTRVGNEDTFLNVFGAKATTNKKAIEILQPYLV